MELNRYEQETIINYNEAEKVASIYTHNKALRRKLERWAEERPEDCRLVRTMRDGQAVEYEAPKDWLHIYPPRSVKPLTEEQKQQRRERLASIRNS